MWRYRAMKRTQKNVPVLLIAAAALIAALISGCGGGGSGTSVIPASSADREYVGSATCNQCHKSHYEDFVRSGHGYKFRTLAQLQDQVTIGLPVPPSDTDIIANLNTSYAGYGLTAANLSTNVGYVIGGYKWKVRFVSPTGYIFTGSKAQYNFQDGTWVSYNAAPTSGTTPTKPYNYECLRCHTTGAEEGSTELVSFGDSAGTGGTFVYGGVQCEACHGKGSRHVNFRESMANPELTAKGLAQDSPLLCGKCHYRNNPSSCDEEPTSSPLDNYSAASNPDGLGTGTITSDRCAAGTWDTDVIIASSGNLKHHEQFQEFTKSKHGFNNGEFTMGCVSCHNPHKPADEETSANATCESCHAKARTDLVKNSAGHDTLECVDCHMPRMVKSAINTQTITTADNTTLKLGDIRTHIVKIMATDSMFPAAGSSVSIDATTGHAYLGVREACQNCHYTGNGNGATAMTSANLQTAVTTVITNGGHDFQ